MDCGLGGLLLLSNTTGSEVSVTVQGITFYVGSHQVLAIPCNGTITTDLGSAVSWVLMAGYQDLFTQNLLLGLAGILCGSMIAWVFMKGI